MMARLRSFNSLLNPLVSVGFPAPKIAFVPLFVFWFGIDHLSKILLVAFTCVFPLIIATYHGATAVNRTVIWSALAMGTSERKMLSKIIFPATLPYIAAGIQVVTPLALLTAFTAEMVAGGGGVGAEVMFAQRFYRTPEVFVYILIMLVSGVLLDRLMLHLNRRAMPWQEPQQNH